MKVYPILCLIALFLVSCSSFEKEQLHGHWKNNIWEFNFRADNTCSMSNSGVPQGSQLKYRTFGNTIEISRDGKVVIGGVTIKSLDEKELKLEFRNLVGSGNKMESIQILKRQ